MKKLWQHEDTGRIVASKIKPSKRHYIISTMCEDELPEGMS